MFLTDIELLGYGFILVMLVLILLMFLGKFLMKSITKNEFICSISLTFLIIFISIQPEIL